MKTLFISLIASIIVSTIFAQTKNAQKFVGLWDFEATSAPYEYQKGRVDISSVGNKLIVSICPAYGSAFETEVLKITDNIISVSFKEDDETVFIDIKEKEGNLFATARSSSISDINVKLVKEDIGKYLGKWKFEANKAPFEYQNGTIELTNIGGKITSKIVVSNKAIEKRPVTYKNEAISFFFQDGETIYVDIKEHAGSVVATATSPSVGVIDVKLFR